MQWNVFFHNYNKNEIEQYNIFNHYSFRYEVKQLIKKYKDKDTFTEKLRKELAYYFLSKCEWEVIVSPWIGKKESCEAKIDVYNQVMLNWDIFADYVWNNKEELLDNE